MPLLIEQPVPFELDRDPPRNDLRELQPRTVGVGRLVRVEPPQAPWIAVSEATGTQIADPADCSSSHSLIARASSSTTAAPDIAASSPAASASGVVAVGVNSQSAADW